MIENDMKLFQIEKDK